MLPEIWEQLERRVYRHCLVYELGGMSDLDMVKVYDAVFRLLLVQDELEEEYDFD